MPRGSFSLFVLLSPNPLDAGPQNVPHTQGTPLIQLRSVQLLRSVFVHYPADRRAVVDELFSSALQNLVLHGKKAPRTFQVGWLLPGRGSSMPLHLPPNLVASVAG